MTRIALILLAAGRSSRFGVENKLHALLQGSPLISHAMVNTQQLEVADRLVVTREDDHKTADLAHKAGFRSIANPLADQGMGTSIACSVSSLKNMDAAFIQPADMPFMSPATYHQLLDAYATSFPQKEIFVPTYQRQKGHPVLFTSSTFTELKALTGDTGARQLMTNRQRVCELEVTNEGILLDIDTKERLQTSQTQKI